MASVPDGCDSVLVLQNFSADLNFKEKLSILNIIDQESYSNIQAQTAGNFSLPGIPIGFGGSFNAFDQDRQTYYQKYDFKEEREVSLSIAKSFISDAQIAAWSQCKSDAATKYGFRCWVESESDETVVISMFWNPYPGAPLNATVTNSTLIGGVLVDEATAPGEALPNGKVLPRMAVPNKFTYNRFSDSEFLLTVVLDGGVHSDSVQLPTQRTIRKFSVPEMPPAGPQQFKTIVDNNSKGFSYRITSGHTKFTVLAYDNAGNPPTEHFMSENKEIILNSFKIVLRSHRPTAASDYCGVLGTYQRL